MGAGWGGWQGFVAMLGVCSGSQVWWESLQGLYWKVTCSDLRKPSSVLWRIDLKGRYGHGES